jgi:hypothetical protein
LVDNAIKYGGDRITLTLTPQKNAQNAVAEIAHVAQERSEKACF